MKRFYGLVAMGLILGLTSGVSAHIGDRIYLLFELSEADLADIDLRDADITDWEDVLGDASLDPTDFYQDPNVGDGAQYDPADLDYRIWLGWNGNLGTIWMGTERIDNSYINKYAGGNSGSLWRHDGIEFRIDGDHTGGDYTGSADENWTDEEKDLNNNRTAQHYLAIGDTPDGRHVGDLGKGTEWVNSLPYADGGGGSTGDGPTTTIIEFFVTPFDDLIWNSPDDSKPSPLFDGKIIGFDIVVPDFDTAPGDYQAFHTLSGQVTSWRYAERFVDGRLVSAGGDAGTAAEDEQAGTGDTAVEDEQAITQTSSYHIATLDHENDIRSVSFSPNGTLLATSEVLIPTVRLWDAASRQQVATLQLEDEDWSTALSFSPDGSLLAVAEASFPPGVSLWDVASRQQVATLQPGGWDFSSLSFSPDGTLLAVGARGGGEVSLWDVATRQQVVILQPSIVVNDLARSYVYSISFSPDGTLLAIAGAIEDNFTVSLWDVASRQQVAILQEGVRFGTEVSFSPDGTLLAVETGGEVSLWDVASRQKVATLQLEDEALSTTLSFSPDGSLLAIGEDAIGNNFSVQLWDVASRQKVATFVHSGSVGDMSFSPDGTLLATGANDGTVQLWDVSEWTGEGTITTDEGTVTTDEGTVTTDEGTVTTDEGTVTTGGQTMPHTLTKVSGDGQEGPASTQLAAPFVVSVLDQDDSPLAGVDVTFAVTAGGGMLSSTTDTNPCIVGSSTSSTTATTDANGQAATRLTLGSEPGSNTVAATVERLEPVTFTATAAEQAMPHSLTKVCGEDQEGTVGILLDRSFVVSVLDEDGAAMAGVVVTFSVTAGGGTLSSATATTEANGRAATRLTLGSQPGTNTVEATVEGLEPVTFTAIGQVSPVVGLFDLFGSGKRVALPDSPQLAQNAPNPFNSQTVLSYFLHAPGLARLEVFALTGQRVAVLHQGPQQAGYHRLHWDGRDDAGRPVASGAYLYRLVTGETVLTRKLTLLR